MTRFTFITHVTGRPPCWVVDSNSKRLGHIELRFLRFVFRRAASSYITEDEQVGIDDKLEQLNRLYAQDDRRPRQKETR